MKTRAASPFARGTSQLATSKRERARRVVAAVPEPSFLDWALRVPEPKTGPLDFDRFPFQLELYQDTATLPETVLVKATQIGISAYLVRWSMFFPDVRGWTGLYVFPKVNLMHDFADARVKELILGSGYLKGRVPHANTQNKGLRKIGLGFVYYRGSESTEGLESIDADLLALDEYDSLVAANVPIAERRLSGSPHGLIRRVGVPSVPGFGLDALYKDTDQRRWFVRCEKCRRSMPVFFRENGHPDPDQAGEMNAYVDRELVRVVCGKCRKPIDVGKGEWVATYPDRDRRGYHASRLIVPAVAENARNMLGEIIRASMSAEPYLVQVHHNRDLGEPYAAKEGRLTLEALRAAQRDDLRRVEGYQGDFLVTAGIDVASVRALNVRISEHTNIGHKRALWIGQVSNFDDLAEMLRRYSVQMFVIDHLPEGRLARAVCEKFPGRGYTCALNGGGMKDVIKIDDAAGTVTVRRTEALDAMMTGIREQRNLLPLDLPEGYAAQMQAPVRFMEKDDLGKVVVAYRSSGADDYAMCEVFDMVAGEVWLYRQQLDALTEGEIVALEDRLEFQRSHLGNPDVDVPYSPGPGDQYSPGFQGEEGFDDPYAAWRDEE